MPGNRWSRVGSFAFTRERSAARAVMIVFDCFAEPAFIGDGGIRKEIDRPAVISSAAPVEGFYTYGEVATTRAARGFHNQTRVVLSIG